MAIQQSSTLFGMIEGQYNASKELAETAFEQVETYFLMRRRRSKLLSR